MLSRDEDDEDERIPPPPAGYSAVTDAQAERSSEPDEVIETVDGDTFDLGSGGRVRLWGVDAPELKQQGWDRQGRPVPIGQSSRSAAAAVVDGRAVSVGESVGSSYGRAVAPITVDSDDVGVTLARQGDALAAPSYLRNDPERRFEYMQAERLARQNGLGVHDTFHQSPEEFRKAPVTSPPREEVAQFWDTPTPLAGMRPEAEAQYVAMLNDASVDPAGIVEFAKANGFIVDPAKIVEVREYAQKVGQQITPAYRSAPQPLTDLGDGATGAAVRGFGSGVLAGALDEAGAVVDTLGLTPNRENLFNSDRRVADIWSNNQEQNSAVLGHDEFAHPYATTGGQIGGSLVVPFGARAKTVPELFRVGAAYGGAEGFLGTDGDIGERAIDAAKGSIVGGLIGAGAGKAIEAGAELAPRIAKRAGLNWPRENAIPAAGAGMDVGTDEMVSADLSRLTPDDIASPLPDDLIAEGKALIEAPHAGTGRPEPADLASGVPRGPGSSAMAMDANPMPSVSQSALSESAHLDMGSVRPTPMSDAVSPEQMQRIADDVMPSDVVPISSNEVGSVDEAAAIDAGRYAPAQAPHERGELTKRTIRSWSGAEVPKVGPVDMVGWLRTQGGLRDQGGELTHMGLTNAARRMEFAGQEARFGPLVNNAEGMTLDDAALRAWEAGYFPDHSERPDVNEFLDALRDTHEGRNRRFLPDDLGEIDRFYGAQGERFALAQQQVETGEAIYTDKSVPAGPDQPFAPPEAHEDWPSGGPDFAGNIDLRKLDSPQDISRALDFTDRRVGFDAATRGRVSHAETERLAADLGMTPDTLLARRMGQAFNAEEALAARQILAKSGNELVNAARAIQRFETPGDDVVAEFREKWLRHAAIQEQVSGMTAEAGRSLQQFRQAANSRAVTADVLAAAVRGGGGRDNLQDVARTLIEAVEAGPGVFNPVVERALKPAWRNKVTELYINFLLSNPSTHAVNITSNLLTSMAQVPEHAAAAGAGKLRQLITRKNEDRIIASEVGARVVGLVQGAREGANLFARALKTGEPADFISKVEGQEYKAIPGVAGEVIRIPTRLLTAEDELFKGIARRMELNGLAIRAAHTEGLTGNDAKLRIAELISNPTDEMLHKADEYGRYLTFQTKLGPIATKVSGVTNESLIAKFFLPFVRTPTNLLKFAAERSPAAPFMPRWQADFKAGGARRDLAVARVLVGSGFGASMYMAAKDGLITGSAPTDPKKDRLLRADGWKPYSVKIGDTYYSYKRLDPFSTTLGVAADLATLPEGMSERQKEDKATLVVASIMGNLANKTWLSGISDVVSALHEPDRYSDNLMQRLIGSLLIPAGVAGLARTIDPTSREVETIGDALQARTPFASRSLLPRRDIWGKEIVSEGGLGPDIMSPVWTSTALNDQVNNELLQLDYAPGYPSRKVGGEELSAEDYDQYVATAGKAAHNQLTTLVGSPEWRKLDDAGKEKAAKRIVDGARRDARSQLFGRDAADDGDNPPDIPPPPEGFRIADGEAGGRNVYAELQEAIPGVRFTSGYRSEEYQEGMRRRGYRPARGSKHLDGSSFDLLPPEGKSMLWLKTHVKRYDPSAKVLNEGDHLHVTFPGYWGAPAIGGAKEAGLRNPNAGMPPPPEGYRLAR